MKFKDSGNNDDLDLLRDVSRNCWFLDDGYSSIKISNNQLYLIARMVINNQHNLDSYQGYTYGE